MIYENPTGLVLVDMGTLGKKLLVNSDKFKHSVLDSLNAKVKEINGNYIKITKRLTDFELLNNIPYKVSANGIEFTDKNGKRIVVEFGNSLINRKTFFKSKFSEAPLVIATNQDSTAFFPGKYKAFQPDLIAVKEVTNKYFMVINKNHFREIRIDWIAIGH